MLGGLGLAVGCARGAVPEYPPIVQVERVAITEQAPVRLLSVRYEYVFDEQGNWREHLRQSYRILNQQGVETWGGTAAGWSPWYMARPELEAQVQDPGGALRMLDLSAVAEAPAHPDLPDIYGDRRVLRAPLPGVHVGSVVTEATRRRTTQPFFPGGSAFQVTVQNAIPRDALELVVDLPASLPFNYELLDARVRKEETLSGGRRHVVFRAQKLEAVEPAEPFSPSNVPEWPSVAFSTGQSWQHIATAYERIMNEKLEGADGVAELARRSVTAGASDVGKANQLLYALHQRVRYVAVEFGQSAVVPASPAEVLRRTYGDCKDQALVLVAMLRAVGLPATLALLRAGPGEDVRPRLPALDVFDHAIVVVQTPEPFWIDPTSEHARAGELPDGDQGRLALIVDSKSRALTLTPSLTASDNHYLETREIRLQEPSLTRVSEASSASGVIEQRLRATFAGTDSERESSLTEYVKKQYSADKLVAARFDGLSDVRRPLRLTLDAEGSRVASLELFHVVVPVEYGLLTSWLPEPVWNDKPRRGDVRLPVRYQAEVRYRVVPPPHYVVRRLPQLPELDFGPARLTRRYEASADGVVTATFTFEIDREHLTLAELAKLKAGLAELDAEAQDRIELAHESEVAFSAGKPRQGMSVLERLAREEPQSARPLLRLATKLGELGFGNRARDRARQATLLEPKSAAAQQTLAVWLQHDEQGRLYGAGADLKGAEAAFRRALELDGADVTSKLGLAGVRERVGTAEALDEAISLYDDVPSETLASYRDGQLAFGAADALLRAHRFDELAQRSEPLPAVYGIATETHRGGALAGMAYAEQRGLEGNARVEALAKAAGAFYTARRYAEASALYAEATRSGGAGVKYASLARVLERTKPIALEQLPDDTPEAVVRKAELLGSALPPPELDLLTSTEPSRLVVADVRAATLRTHVAGSAALGFRVRVQAGSSSFHRYVVKGRAGYELRGSLPEDLGCEALRRLALRDVAGARQWLAWAAERSNGDVVPDPLRDPPFLRLWAGGEGDVELAAAALCASRKSGGQAARDLLERSRSGGKADASALNHALALAARAALAPAEQLAAAERLLTFHPGSRVARELQLEALWTLERFVDVEREAHRAANVEASTPARWSFLQWRGQALARLGKVNEALRVYQQAIELAGASELMTTYNQLAWGALFAEPRPPQAREHAELAVEASQRKSFVALHTLACVLLDVGDVAAARVAFQELLALDSKPHLSDDTRYVQAGLAEAYGLRELARELYQSVKRPEDGAPLSSYALARRRLAALER